MKISNSPTREQFPLSARKIWKKAIASTSILGIFIPLVFLFVVWKAFFSFGKITPENTLNYVWMGIFIFVGFLLFLFLCSYLYQRWYFAVYFYDLTEDHIIIRKGPITPKEITIPYERVQDVYVDQDLWDRIFGLYDVHLSSATVSSGMEAHIDGVMKTAADGLKQTLLQKVHERISQKKQSI
ncbi:MAG: PH domain-containing protein [Candidatus Gribaldobacteria bacterium]|nr:PH domain-containing protein [Candidatus Gribaldobacteria bacterium]